MRTQTISFPDQPTPRIFPNERSHLAQEIAEVGLESGYPVIVLVGGEIDEKQADVTRRAIQAALSIDEKSEAGTASPVMNGV